MDYAAFFREAFNTIARAVAELGVDADLDRKPLLIAKTVKRRCMGEMRRLSILIRRLIFLMALSVELGPLKPRPGGNWFRPEPDEGFPHYRALCLTPESSGVFPDTLRASSGALPRPGPVEAAPVLVRWRMLLEALKHRDRRAKRLARTLQRWKEKGEARPYVRPIPRVHRWPAELGLISGALQVQMLERLKRWPDTG